MLSTYEFHRYHATPDGDLSMEPVEVVRMPCFDQASARSVARKMARKHQGPVDVAVAGASPWNDRYIGTATPKYPYTACKVTVFEKLN
jgi:hypothetical protein